MAALSEDFQFKLERWPGNFKVLIKQDHPPPGLETYRESTVKIRFPCNLTAQENPIKIETELS